jgi:hypothetical protein
LLDRDLFDFKAVAATGAALEGGGKAFDPEGEFTIFSNLE